MFLENMFSLFKTFEEGKPFNKIDSKVKYSFRYSVYWVINSKIDTKVKYRF